MARGKRPGRPPGRSEPIMSVPVALDALVRRWPQQHQAILHAAQEGRAYAQQWALIVDMHRWLADAHDTVLALPPPPPMPTAPAPSSGVNVSGLGSVLARMATDLRDVARHVSELHADFTKKFSPEVVEHMGLFTDEAVVMGVFAQKCAQNGGFGPLKATDLMILAVAIGIEAPQPVGNRLSTWGKTRKTKMAVLLDTLFNVDL